MYRLTMNIVTTSAMHQIKELVINWHITDACNCETTFGRFIDHFPHLGQNPREELERLQATAITSPCIICITSLCPWRCRSAQNRRATGKASFPIKLVPCPRRRENDHGPHKIIQHYPESP